MEKWPLREERCHIHKREVKMTKKTAAVSIEKKKKMFVHKLKAIEKQNESPNSHACAYTNANTHFFMHSVARLT